MGKKEEHIGENTLIEEEVEEKDPDYVYIEYNLFGNKASKSMIIIGSILLLVVIALLLIVSAANLNLRINGTTGGYASNVRLKLNPNASLGYDAYDMDAPPNPGNLSVFYVAIPGYNLTIDSWNESSNPRTLNLSYLLPVVQSGIINFSWQSIIGSQLLGYFIYFGTNATYASGGNISNLRTNISYNNTLNANSQLFIQVNISNIGALNVNINSTNGTNNTLDNLNCYTTLIDPDPGHVMNVTLYWYKNNQSNLTFNYNNNYANASFFYSTLNNLNTTKGDNWSCGIITFDAIETSVLTNSSNLSIINSLPTVNLTNPLNNTMSFNRKPTFNWTSNDSDSDTLTYDINISLVAASTCSDPDRNIAGITTLNYTVATYLKCLSDNSDYYIWKVRAYDGQNYSNWSKPFNFSIQANLTISLPTNAADFGNMNPGDNDNTTDNNPLPILISNDVAIFCAIF